MDRSKVSLLAQYFGKLSAITVNPELFWVKEVFSSSKTGIGDQGIFIFQGAELA